MSLELLFFVVKEKSRKSDGEMFKGEDACLPVGGPIGQIPNTWCITNQ